MGYENGEILIWSSDQNTVLAIIKAHNRPVVQLEFSNDGSLLLSSDNKRLFVHAVDWTGAKVRDNISSSSSISRLVPISQTLTSKTDVLNAKILCLRNDGSLVAVPMDASKSIRAIDTGNLTNVEISQDGLHFAGYDPATKNLIVRCLNTTKPPLTTLVNPTVEDNNHSKIEFDPKRDHYAFDVTEQVMVVSGADGYHVAFDFTGMQLWCVPPSSYPISNSPIINSIQKWVALRIGNNTQLVNLQSGTVLTQTHDVLAFARRNPEWICRSVLGVRTFRTYDRDLILNKFNKLKNTKPILLVGHTKPVSHATFSDDDSRLFTGSEDETVRIWNTQNGEEMLILHKFEKPVGGICLINNGMALLAASESGEFKIFDATERASRVESTPKK